jgi:hypothetical protein
LTKPVDAGVKFGMVERPQVVDGEYCRAAVYSRSDHDEVAAAVDVLGEHPVSFDRDFRKLLGRGQLTLLEPQAS